MKLQAEWVEYRSDGEPLAGYLARPAGVSGPLPAVVVIMEIWGVDDHIQDVVRRVATAGYLALAPDLYSRGGRRPAAVSSDRIEMAKAFLDSIPPAAWQNPADRQAAVDRLPEPDRTRVGETLGVLLSPKRPMAQYTGDLRAAVRYLQHAPGSAGQRVGSVGFCMGGALSALLACVEPELSAAVIFYGSAPSAEQVSGIRCPVLGFYGGDDPRITQGVPAFAEAMRAAGKVFEHDVYPGAPHAFFNDTRRSFRVDAARQAWGQTLAFFGRHLAPA